MADPILRAMDSTGEVYDDPSEDALFMFMEDLEPLCPEASERPIAPTLRGHSGTLAQVSVTALDWGARCA